MILQVRLLKRCVADLEEIRRYIDRERPEAAHRVIERILHAAESLANNPARGAQPRDERLRRLGYRFMVVRPYLVFYKVAGRVVRVYRVLHGRQRYQRLL